MISANNGKWVPSYLFGCGKVKFGIIATGHSHPLMFIAALLLAWPLHHRYPHLTEWVSKPGQVPWEFEQAA